MNIGTSLNIKLFCKKVGEDEYGNIYYLSKFKNSEGKAKRLIQYKGITEASSVPPLFHGWLHYMQDDFPSMGDKYSWQKPREPNQTGTKQAYLPLGHITKNTKRQQTSNDYQPWNPDI